MTPPEEIQELLFYTSPDGKVKMEIRIEGETIWMTQQMMAELFQTSVQNISNHIENILQSAELQAEGTIKENLIVRQEGSRKVQRETSSIPRMRGGVSPRRQARKLCAPPERGGTNRNSPHGERLGINHRPNISER